MPVMNKVKRINLFNSSVLDEAKETYMPFGGHNTTRSNDSNEELQLRVHQPRVRFISK